MNLSYSNNYFSRLASFISMRGIQETILTHSNKQERQATEMIQLMSRNPTRSYILHTNKILIFLSSWALSSFVFNRNFKSRSVFKIKFSFNWTDAKPLHLPNVRDDIVSFAPNMVAKQTLPVKLIKFRKKMNKKTKTTTTTTIVIF